MRWMKDEVDMLDKQDSLDKLGELYRLIAILLQRFNEFKMFKKLREGFKKEFCLKSSKANNLLNQLQTKNNKRQTSNINLFPSLLRDDFHGADADIQFETDKNGH